MTPALCRKCGSAPVTEHNPERGYRVGCPKRDRVRGRRGSHRPAGSCPSAATAWRTTKDAALGSWNLSQDTTRDHRSTDRWQFANMTACPRCHLRGGAHTEQDIADGLCLSARGDARDAGRCQFWSMRENHRRYSDDSERL